MGMLLPLLPVFGQCDQELSVTLSPEAPGDVYCAYDTVKLSAPEGFAGYQWYWNSSSDTTGGNPIPGAVAATYLAPVAEYGFAYFYVEAVYQDTCQATSPAVVIDSWVFLSPAIAHDADTELCFGDSALIENAFGEFAAYQWLRNGAPLPGANQSFYWVTEPGVYTLETSPEPCPLLTLSSGVGPVFTLSGPATPVITQQGNQLVADSGPFFQWAFEGMDIPGATEAAFQPEETGNYTVAAIDENGCTAVSEPFFFEATSLETPDPARTFRLFPNPVGRMLYVVNPGYSDYRLFLYTASGREALRADGSGGATTAFDLSSLAPGQYFARIQGAGRTQVYPVVKR